MLVLLIFLLSVIYCCGFGCGSNAENEKKNKGGGEHMCISSHLIGLLMM